MVNWSTTWGMLFNPTKCKVMRLTRKDTDPPSYKMLGVDLEETKDDKYLGTYLQSDLRWNKQVNHAKNKATRTLNFLKRNFHHTSSSVKEKLFDTLVRPHLDYASAAWDPYTNKNIDHLEKVQNAAARFITNTYGKDTSVTALKDQLGWPSLQERRRNRRLNCLYKILNDHMDIDKTKYIQQKIE